MEQHPVPQQISSYRFKLVGDMTLKQFLEVASGVGVAIILYGLGLPGLIKWPLIIISVCIGGALAFIPFEERPLEQWIFAFFRSIYSPTLFYWKKSVPTDFFQAEGTTSISGTPTITDTQTPPGAKGEEPQPQKDQREVQQQQPQPMVRPKVVNMPDPHEYIEPTRSIKSQNRVNAPYNYNEDYDIPAYLRRGNRD
jgi:hypothetical protein